ncbi:MAG: hypothetical protein PHP73_07060 [Candidatus Omnitrophica bacterium]|nr:hypothetical protein [Candidatus Omnitrophota bacterium]
MKITLAVFILTAAFLFSGCASISGPAAKNSVNIYRYNRVPHICFFPAAQAKWDGYKVTNKDWDQLDEYQKLVFILEGVKELEKNEAVVIALTDTSRTITALDYGVNKINKEIPKTRISMISFMYDVLKDAKMVAPSQAKKGGEDELRKL